VADIRGYLRRLGLDDPGPPSLAGLTAIHRAQVERVAYTTVDIHLGRATTVDPDETVDRVVRTGRAGYCFHLNGALAAVLRHLGYDVRLHRGGVWSAADEVPLQPYANHLALTVHGLSTPDNPAGDWFVDAGLGDALHDPMPLRSGPVTQGPFTYSLAASPVLVGGWRFTHDPAGSFVAMDFEPRAAVPADFAASHHDLSTSPTSPFRRYLLAQRRDATGVDKLVSCGLRRLEGKSVTESVLVKRTQWLAALADIFGITLDDVAEGERDRLWRRARAAQVDWERSQG
jgi:arylamine N-acetyltransferase